VLGIGTIRDDLGWPETAIKKHLGELVAQGHVKVDPVANIHLWFDEDCLVAYAWFEPPLSVDFDLRPGLPDAGGAMREVLAWAEERRRSLGPAQHIPKAYASRGAETLSTQVLESDPERQRVLLERGYRKTAEHSMLYSRSLRTEVPAPSLPYGMQLRHAEDADLEARAELHRDAWSVWGKSSVTAETYAALRAAPEYEAELDVVLADADGRLISYCIAWADAPNGIGHFEPVGCRPAYTGRGCARAVLFEGMRRMKARGLTTARGGTASVNERALKLYPSCAFEEVDRAYSWVKEM
jgi:ribosomal protein S18 acetylase RimI-like enzyme